VLVVAQLVNKGSGHAALNKQLQQCLQAELPHPQRQQALTLKLQRLQAEAAAFTAAGESSFSAVWQQLPWMHMLHALLHVLLSPTHCIVSFCKSSRAQPAIPALLHGCIWAVKN
jgi:hypothetical protein